MVPPPAAQVHLALGRDAAVVDHQARVEAPRPPPQPEVLQQLRNGIGGHDLARHHHHRGPELGEVCHPRIGRHDDLVGGDGARRGLDLEPLRPRRDAADGRALVHLRAQGERRLAQAPREERRLHPRRALVDHPRQIGALLPEHLAQLFRAEPSPRRREAHLVGGAERGLPRSHLGRSGRAPYRAAAAPLAWQLALGHDGFDVLDPLDAGPEHAQRVLLAEHRDQGGQLAPPGADAAAAAAAGPGAAEIGLDDGDRHPGIQLAQADRRPQPGESAPDDGDVDPARALEDGGRLGRRAEGLV